MNLPRSSLKILLTAMAALQLGACSKTVQWEEEVPLNTGETIWIKRSMPWEIRSGTGNPLDFDMRPDGDKQSYQFTYRGKAYSYAEGARIIWIAISPSGEPNLLARSADFAWDSRNNYTCVTPQYVQLVPDASGRVWTWPKKIEPWVYELPANVMANFPRLEEQRKERYTAQERDQRDKKFRLQFEGVKKIDANFKSSCITDGTPYMNKDQGSDWNKK